MANLKANLKTLKDYLIVDTHNHLYAKAEHGQGVRQMENATKPGFETDSFGVIEDALKNMERGNIAKTFILPLMPVMMMRHTRVTKLHEGLSDKERKKAEDEIDQLLIGRIQRMNRWACQVGKENPRFVPFIIVDPIMGPELMRQEMKGMIMNHGAKGVGEIIPDEMGWSVDGLNANDPALWPIWETAIELNVPVNCHFGPSHPHPLDPNKTVFNNTPEYYDDVVDRFPKLKMVELHMNKTMPGRWPEIYEASLEAGIAFAKRHPNVICDISGNLGYGTPLEDLVEVIREVGAERVIWGSDFLWVNPVMEVELLIQSSLTEKEKRLVLGENAVRFFDLKI
ncbi:amidohydrolase family protein [Chloroflexota bacterium]